MNSGRESAHGALVAAIEAADPGLAFRKGTTRSGPHLHFENGPSFDLERYRRIWIVGAGKATPKLARAVIEALGRRLAGGTISTKDGYGLALPIDLWEAGHPVPDMRSLASAAEALIMARRCDPEDLLICLLSGGASSLWTAPAPGLGLGDLIEVTDQLLRSGAPITELNVVRKHLSSIAGGRLAEACRAGELLTIAISDVLGDHRDMIGSGPTLPDPSHYRDALAILEAYNLPGTPAALAYLRAGAAGRVPETPKPDDPGGPSSFFQVIASVREAVQGAATFLRSRGYTVEIVDEACEGEAREVGREIARRALEVARSAAEPRALLWGGETTVQVRGRGRGGRNQEAVLAAALEVQNHTGITIACCATDGTDGPTDAAGGIVDGGTCGRAVAHGIDPRAALADNDAYSCLSAAGDLLRTGPTGTNVNDILLALITPADRAPAGGDR